KQLKRDDRKQILIDSLSTVYYPDASQPMAAPDLSTFVGTNPAAFAPPSNPEMGSGLSSGGEMGAAGSNPMEGQPQAPSGPSSAGGTAGAQRGFLVTLQCVSPYATAQELINKEFFPALRMVAPDAANPHKEFAIVKPTIVTARKIQQDETRKAK